jgi:hypothetical protein
MNIQLSVQTGENSAHTDTKLQQIYVEETVHIMGFNYVKNINMERMIFHTMKDLAIRQFQKLM